MDAGEQLRNAGWEQGAIFQPPDALVEQLAGAPAAWAIVLSQDCDIVHSTEVEPYIEVLACVVPATNNFAIWHGRNPRRLQLPLHDGNSCLEVDIRRRAFVDKSLLTTLHPSKDYKLAPREIRDLANWLGRRYKRAAFPDEFNRRLARKHAKLDALAKKPSSRFVSIPMSRYCSKNEDLGIRVSTSAVPKRTLCSGNREATLRRKRADRARKGP
jgi:hypothetical protein